MKEGCLICKAPLEYLLREEMMECAICRKQEHLKVPMEKSVPVCSRSGRNKQCIGKRCPFIGGKK